MYTVHVRLAGLFTLYPSIFFSLRVFFARTWTLACGRSALLLCYNPYARVRTVISVLPRISATPFPLMNIFSISSHLSQNQSITHPSRISIPYTLYFYSHSGRNSPLVLFSHLFCVFIACRSTGASFKPLGTTICPFCSIFAPLPSSQPPHVFSENFTRTQFPHFSPHPGFTISKCQIKRNPLSHRSCA
jgi:hypothetical protein